MDSCSVVGLNEKDSTKPGAIHDFKWFTTIKEGVVVFHAHKTVGYGRLRKPKPGESAKPRPGWDSKEKLLGGIGGAKHER